MTARTPSFFASAASRLGRTDETYKQHNECIATAHGFPSQGGRRWERRLCPDPNSRIDCRIVEKMSREGASVRELLRKSEERRTIRAPWPTNWARGSVYVVCELPRVEFLLCMTCILLLTNDIFRLTLPLQCFRFLFVEIRFPICRTMLRAGSPHEELKS